MLGNDANQWLLVLKLLRLQEELLALHAQLVAPEAPWGVRDTDVRANFFNHIGFHVCAAGVC